MTDLSYRVAAEVDRRGDLDMRDIEIGLHEVRPGAIWQVDAPHRGFFLHAVSGSFELATPREPAAFILAAGGSVGLESGAGITCRNTSQRPALLFTSSAGRKPSVGRLLIGGCVAIPAGDRLAASAAGLVGVLVGELRDRNCEPEFVARLNEALLLLVMRAAERAIGRAPQLPIDSRLALLRAWTSYLGPTSARRMPERIRKDVSLAAAWRAFFASPDQQWTADRLAQAAGLSRRAFFARFRDAFGMPPIRFLREARLEQAAYLMRHSGLPTAQIAEAVGYSSDTAFIRAFHRHYGTTPAVWRGRRDGGVGHVADSQI